MSIWVKLKNQESQIWDGQIGWGIKLDEVKQLPDKIPSGSLLAGRLRMGALVECDAPLAQWEAVQVPAPEEILKQETIQETVQIELPTESEPSTKPKTTRKRPAKRPSTSRKRKV